MGAVELQLHIFFNFCTIPWRGYSVSRSGLFTPQRNSLVYPFHIKISKTITRPFTSWDIFLLRLLNLSSRVVHLLVSSVHRLLYKGFPKSAQWEMWKKSLQVEFKCAANKTSYFPLCSLYFVLTHNLVYTYPGVCGFVFAKFQHQKQ
jgi:hypothetical protein